MKLRNILILIAVVAALCGLSFFLGHRNAVKHAPVPQVDTVTIRDTTWDYSPEKTVLPAGYDLVPLDTLKLLDKYSSMLDNYSATIAELKDSLERKPKVVYVNGVGYISVPLFNYNFTDHKTYECEVTGYNVKMLWHKSIRETQYITKTVSVPTLPKFAISPDFSALVGPKVFFLGAGVKLDIWAGNWRFSPGLDYGLIWGGDKWAHGPVATFSANYNFIIK